MFNGYQATVLIPKNFNGKWIWKTEFLYAFDQAERRLYEMGYARVYYNISDKYGSVYAIRLMHNFHLELLRLYPNFDKKSILFGFSRGALYAFNYALYYPEYISKIYLDAPVLNLKSWPPLRTKELEQVFEEYNLDVHTFKVFKDSPIDCLDEFFNTKIPIMLIAGDNDTCVPFNDNGRYMVEYCKNNNILLKFILKENCGHHPHSLENVKPIIDFVKNDRL